MRKTIKLTERDLTRIVKRIINEDRERFTVDEFKSGLKDGTTGTWRIEGGSLLLEMPGDDIQYNLHS